MVDGGEFGVVGGGGRGWVSLKEAKETFLIPEKMTSLIFLIINHLVRPQGIFISNFKFLAIQEVLFLLQVFDASLKEAKGTFLTPEGMTSMKFASFLI